MIPQSLREAPWKTPHYEPYRPNQLRIPQEDLSGTPGAARGPGPVPGFYNYQRAHQGYRLKGRTPMKALEDYLDTQREEVKEAA